MGILQEQTSLYASLLNKLSDDAVEVSCKSNYHKVCQYLREGQLFYPSIHVSSPTINL
jgi:hypothetical protein